MECGLTFRRHGNPGGKHQCEAAPRGRPGRGARGIGVKQETWCPGLSSVLWGTLRAGSAGDASSGPRRGHWTGGGVEPPVGRGFGPDRGGGSSASHSGPPLVGATLPERWSVLPVPFLACCPRLSAIHVPLAAAPARLCLRRVPPQLGLGPRPLRSPPSTLHWPLP